MKLISGAGRRVNGSGSTHTTHRTTEHREQLTAQEGRTSRQAAELPLPRTEQIDPQPNPTVRRSPSVYGTDTGADALQYRDTPRAADPDSSPAAPRSYSTAYRSASLPNEDTPDYGIAYNRDSSFVAQTHLHPYSVPASHRQRQKKDKIKRRAITLSSILAGLVLLYCLAVFSHIPFIEKWRTVYVETALMTRSHQWLATAILPKSVVDKARAAIDQVNLEQENLESDWGDAQPISTMRLPAITRPTMNTEVEPSEDSEVDPEPVQDLPFWADPESDFCRTYAELDMETFAAYAEEHEDEMFDADGNLFIDESGLDQNGTPIYTVQGDQVLALDTVHGITIARLENSGDTNYYRGVIALIKDPSTVGVAVASRLGIVGQKIAGLAKDSGAILAINASGFEDEDRVGNGGAVYGLLYSNGERYHGTAADNCKAVYFDYENRLHVNTWKKTEDIRDGVEFKPALVVNGEQVITGSAGWGVAARTAIGQREDGTIIMIVIDGRQTSSIGTTVGEVAGIMLRYGAVQAINLDGGASSIMYYNGRKITQPCGGDKENGRYLPDAFVVYADRKATDPADGN